MRHSSIPRADPRIPRIIFRHWDDLWRYVQSCLTTFPSSTSFDGKEFAYQGLLTFFSSICLPPSRISWPDFTRRVEEHRMFIPFLAKAWAWVFIAENRLALVWLQRPHQAHPCLQDPAKRALFWRLFQSCNSRDIGETIVRKLDALAQIDYNAAAISTIKESSYLAGLLLEVAQQAPQVASTIVQLRGPSFIVILLNRLLPSNTANLTARLSSWSRALSFSVVAFFLQALKALVEATNVAHRPDIMTHAVKRGLMRALYKACRLSCNRDDCDCTTMKAAVEELLVLLGSMLSSASSRLFQKHVHRALVDLDRTHRRISLRAWVTFQADVAKLEFESRVIECCGPSVSSSDRWLSCLRH